MRQMREDVAVKFALGKIVGTGRQDDMSLWPTRSLMAPVCARRDDPFFSKGRIRVDINAHKPTSQSLS